VTGFVIETAAGESDASPRFFDNVLYGFETIESARDAMVGLVVATLSSVEESNPSIIRVETLEEAEDLLQRSAVSDESAWVSLPLELYEWFTNQADELAGPRSGE
jgi:hypothetical protein